MFAAFIAEARWEDDEAGFLSDGDAIKLVEAVRHSKWRGIFCASMQTDSAVKLKILPSYGLDASIGPSA